LFTNTYLAGPGDAVLNTVLINQDAYEHTVWRNMRVGALWGATSASRFLSFDEGSFDGEFTFDVCDSNFWESGGHVGSFAQQVLVNAIATPDDAESVRLIVRGPEGCSPGALISQTTMAGFADDNTNVLIDGGARLGVVAFQEGELVAPPDCHFSKICQNVTLDEDFNFGSNDVHYIDLNDCSVNAAENDADNFGSGLFVATKICGFYAIQDGASGPGGDYFNYTLRTGAAGSLADSNSECRLSSSSDTHCWGGPTYLDPSDKIVMEITPSGNPPDEVVDFVVWSDTDLAGP
jgi:hypothetical protein